MTNNTAYQFACGHVKRMGKYVCISLWSSKVEGNFVPLPIHSNTFIDSIKNSLVKNQMCHSVLTSTWKRGRVRNCLKKNKLLSLVLHLHSTSVH